MKIAHVVATFSPHLGGMGQVALEECGKLAEAGHNATIFTIRYPGVSYPDDGQFFKIIRLRSFIKMGDAGFVPQLFVRLRNFDLVHLHYPWYGGAEWVWLAKVFFRQKYVVTYHMDAAPRGFVRRLVRFLYDVVWARAILRGAEKVLVVDKNYFAKSKFAVEIDSSKIIELPNGVDTEVFRVGQRNLSPHPLLCGGEGDEHHPSFAKEGAGGGFAGNQFLFVGNLMPVKRLDLLVEAMRQLHGVYLTIVGSGYEEERYKKMTTDYGLQTTVTFVGSVVTRQKLAEYYSTAFCLVVPSDAESFSLVALEAMACGCPVIASDIPGVRERVVDGVTGFLFTPGSVENLVEAIKRFLRLSDEERKAMGERGRRMVEEKFGLEMHVKKLEEIYNQC